MKHADCSEGIRTQPANRCRELIVAVDSGTQSTRCIVYEADTMIKRSTSNKYTHELRSPHEGWSEHVVAEIEAATIAALKDGLAKFSADHYTVVGIGITNQRETIVAWDATTGELLSDMTICWNDGRTHDYVEGAHKTWPKETIASICHKTGLKLNSYYSATKMRWMVENVPDVADALADKRLRFGTIDSFLIYRLTNHEVHATDVSNASRTLLFNCREMKWDEELCEQFGIPLWTLPTVNPSACKRFGKCKNGDEYLRPEWRALPALLAGTPITGCIGDQQAATMGHDLFNAGDAKLTFGSGGFLLMNCGKGIPKQVPGGCTLSPLYQVEGDEVNFSVEGSIAFAGMGITWLKKNQLVELHEIDPFMATTPTNEGVIFVPAFSGILSPWWNEDIKATISGMSLTTERRHIVRAFLEALAVQVCAILEDMETTGATVNKLYLDGGLSQSDRFMQIISDFTGATLNRPPDCEMTARGAGLMAKIGASEVPKESLVQMMEAAHNQVNQDIQANYSTKFHPTEVPEYAAYIARTKKEWLALTDTLIAHYTPKEGPYDAPDTKEGK